MKKIALIGTLLISASTVAHENSFNISSDNCEVEFQNDVRISDQDITIENKANNKISISRKGEVYVQGERVDLSAAQRQAASHYSDSLRAELPKVAEIALDAVKIAGVALEEVGTALDMDSLKDMHEIMDELSVEVKYTFYQQNDFVMGEKTFNEFGDQFSDKFESRLEDAIQSTMFQSVGSLLVTLGSEMISSGGNMDEFGERMDRMGKNIDEKVEKQAKVIEARADQLCGDFAALAEQENTLTAAVPALADYKLFAYKTKI